MRSKEILMNTASMNTDLGQTIRAARTARGMSYGQLEVASGVSRGTIFRIENGQHRKPLQHVLRQLAATLDLLPADLYAAAGYDQAGLPTIRPYLRSKYPELPDNALDEIAAITRKYGLDPANTGPRPGEDEQ